VRLVHDRHAERRFDLERLLEEGERLVAAAPRIVARVRVDEHGLERQAGALGRQLDERGKVVVHLVGRAVDVFAGRRVNVTAGRVDLADEAQPGRLHCRAETLLPPHGSDRLDGLEALRLDARKQRRPARRVVGSLDAPERLAQLESGGHYCEVWVVHPVG